MKQKINLKERYKSYMSIINFFSTLIDFLSYFTDFFEKLNGIWLISIIMTFILLIFFVFCLIIIDFKKNSFGEASMSLSDNFIYDFENALFDYNWNYVVSPSSKSKEELAFCILLIFLKIIKFYSAYIFWKKSLYFEKN